MNEIRTYHSGPFAGLDASRLDFSEAPGVFVERLCEKISQFHPKWELAKVISSLAVSAILSSAAIYAAYIGLSSLACFLAFNGCIYTFMGYDFYRELLNASQSIENDMKKLPSGRFKLLYSGLKRYDETMIPGLETVKNFLLGTDSINFRLRTETIYNIQLGKKTSCLGFPTGWTLPSCQIEKATDNQAQVLNQRKPWIDLLIRIHPLDIPHKKDLLEVFAYIAAGGPAFRRQTSGKCSAVYRDTGEFRIKDVKTHRIFSAPELEQVLFPDKNLLKSAEAVV